MPPCKHSLNIAGSAENRSCQGTQEVSAAKRSFLLTELPLTTSSICLKGLEGGGEPQK